MLKARAKAGLTQEAVAVRHAPPLATLKRYASAVGCELQVKRVPQKSA